MLRTGLAVVRKIENMDHIVLLLPDHLPTVVNDRAQPERLVVLLPPVPDENRIRIWQRLELELYQRPRRQYRST
jgi:hypothetical protein